MWEADPDLERSVIIQQGIEKMLAHIVKLYDKKQALVTVLIYCITKK